jgi:ComF family protein
MWIRGALRAAGRLARDLGVDLIDVALDRRCPGCGGSIARHLDVCEACDAAIPRAGIVLCLRCLRGDAAGGDPPGACPLHGSSRLLLAGPAFEPPLDRIVHAFKYEGASRLASWLASLVPELPGALSREAVLVPVPLHPAKRAARGFDQTALLADVLSRCWGVPAVAVLARTVDTSPQVRLDPAARRRNLTGAFRLLAPALITRRPVLLLDDVATTGSTLLAAADAVLGAGPSLVLGLATAHGGHPAGPSDPPRGEVAAADSDVLESRAWRDASPSSPRRS